MLPSFQSFFDPVMSALRSGHERVPAIASHAAQVLDLAPHQRVERISYDQELTIEARSRMVLIELAHAGLVHAHDRAYSLTDTGRQWDTPLERTSLSNIPEYAAYRAKQLARRGA